MRKLSIEEVEELANGKGVRRIAVENFLGTVDNNPDVNTALLKLTLDAGRYHWNVATVNAIRKGIYTSGNLEH